MTAPTIPYPASPASTTPGQYVPSTTRGTASLTSHGGTLVFRTNPNEVWWSYTLNTVVEQTYGGRVVQILGVRIDDLTVKVDCGAGGWRYLQQVMTFMRDMMIAQRDGKPGTFTYTTRNWKMNVYAASVPCSDTVTATTRELELTFKVQEDISGVMSQMSIATELASLQDGVGWRSSQYNTAGTDLVQTETQNWVSPMSIPTNLLDMMGISGISTIGRVGSQIVNQIGSVLSGTPVGQAGIQVGNTLSQEISASPIGPYAAQIGPLASRIGPLASQVGPLASQVADIAAGLL